MSHLIVHGGRPLRGSVFPSANKNAVLPILCATLLTREPVVLHRVPDITDVRKLLAFFRELGSAVDIDFATGTLRLQHGSGLCDHGVRLPSGMRSSIMLVPALLQRFGRARLQDDVTGCTLGVREIDPHIDVFLAFGAEVALERAATTIRTPRRFAASDHWLDYASVTTTENFVLCAAAARGRSRLVNAACEPHVQEFCAFLTLMGARIEGSGSSLLQVEGVAELGGAEYTFADDFHEVATFLALERHHRRRRGGAERRGGAVPAARPHLRQVRRRARASSDGFSRARRRPRLEGAADAHRPPDAEGRGRAVAVRARRPAADLRRARRAGRGSDAVLEQGLRRRARLERRAGQVRRDAELRDPHRLIVHGGRPLRPATVESPYIIRVAIALFMVAASIDGRSVIRHALPIRRAHPRFAENLNALGAGSSGRRTRRSTGHEEVAALSSAA